MGNFFGDNAMRKSGMGGFTLIELLITVVILGILVGVGYPQYTRYITETRRSDATINLTRIAALQEKFFTECGRYTPNFNGAIFDPNPALRCTGLGVALTAGSFTTTDGYYTLTIPILVPGPTGVPGGGGYTLSAAPAGAQLGDAAKCTTFTITNTGVKAATGTDGNPLTGGKCWKR
jgi:type IV pilus assembly protein PilE